MAIVKRSGIAGAACSVMVIIGIVLSHGHVRTNKQGLELIGNAESCRRDPYICPAGIATDGVGNTHNVFAGKTDEQIANDWERNILDAESCVNRYANGKKLTDGTFSAAVSIAFNTGCKTIRTSTMFQLLRSGDIKAACEQFPRWIYGGGKKLPGLVTRRDKERALCLSDLH